MTSDASPIQPSLSIEAGKLPHQEQISAQKWGHTFTKIAYASAAVAAVAFTVALVAAVVFFTGGAALPVFIALGSVAALSGGGALIAKFFQEKFAQKESAIKEENVLASRLYEILGKDMTIEDFEKVKNINAAAEDKSKLTDFLELVNKRNQGEEISDQQLLDAYYEIKVPDGSDVLKGGIYAKILFIREPSNELPYANLNQRLMDLLGDNYSSAEARKLLTRFKDPLDQVRVAKVVDALESMKSAPRSDQLRALGTALAAIGENKELKDIAYSISERVLGFNVKKPAEWIAAKKLSPEKRDLAWFYASNILSASPAQLPALKKEFIQMNIHDKQGELFDMMLDFKAGAKLQDLRERLTQNPNLNKTAESSQFLEEVQTFPRFYGTPLEHLIEITDAKGPPFLTFDEISKDIQNPSFNNDAVWAISKTETEIEIVQFVLFENGKVPEDPNAFYAVKMPTPIKSLYERISLPVNASREEKIRMLQNVRDNNPPETKEEIDFQFRSVIHTAGLGVKRDFSNIFNDALKDTKLTPEQKKALDDNLLPLQQMSLIVLLRNMGLEKRLHLISKLSVEDAKWLADKATLDEARSFVILSSFKNEIPDIQKIENSEEKRLRVIQASQAALSEISKMPDGLIKDRMLRALIGQMENATDGDKSIPKGGFNYSDALDFRDKLSGNPIYFIGIGDGLRTVKSVDKNITFDESVNFSQLGLNSEESEFVKKKWVLPEEQLALKNFLLAAVELKNAPRGPLRTEAILKASAPFLKLLLDSQLNLEDRGNLLLIARKAISPEDSLIPYNFKEVTDVLPNLEGQTLYTIKADNLGLPYLQKFNVEKGAMIYASSDLKVGRSTANVFKGNVHQEPIAYSHRDYQFINNEFNDFTVRTESVAAEVKNASGDLVEIKFSTQMLKDLSRTPFTINGRYFPKSESPDRKNEILQALFEAVGYDPDRLYFISTIMHQGAAGSTTSATLQSKPENKMISQSLYPGSISINIDTRGDDYKLTYLTNQVSRPVVNEDIMDPEYVLILSRQYSIPAEEVKRGEANKGSYDDIIVKTHADTILKNVPEALKALNDLQIAIAQAKNINDPDSLEKIILAQSALLKIIEQKKNEPYYKDLLNEVNGMLHPDGQPHAIRMDALMSIKDRFKNKEVYLIFQHAGSMILYSGKVSPKFNLKEVMNKSFEEPKKIDPFLQGKPKIEQKDIGARGLDLFWQEPDITDLVEYDVDGKKWQIPSVFLRDVSRTEFEINDFKFPIGENLGRTDEILRQFIDLAGGDEKKLQRLLILCSHNVGLDLKNNFEERAKKHFSETVFTAEAEMKVKVNNAQYGVNVNYQCIPTLFKLSEGKIPRIPLVNVLAEMNFVVSDNDLSKGFGETSQSIITLSHIKPKKVLNEQLNPILKHIPTAESEFTYLQFVISQAKNINDPDSLEKIVLAQSALLKIIAQKKDEPYYKDLLNEVNRMLHPDGQPHAIRMDALMSIKDRFKDKEVYLIFQHAGSMILYSGKVSPKFNLKEVMNKSFEEPKKIDPFLEGNPKIEKNDIGARGLDLFWQEPDITDLVEYVVDEKKWHIPMLFLKDVSRTEFEINDLKFPIGDNPERTDKILRLFIDLAGGDEKKLQRLLILCNQNVGITLKNNLGMRALRHFNETVFPGESEMLVKVKMTKNGVNVNYQYLPEFFKISEDGGSKVPLMNILTEMEFAITENDLSKGYGETSQSAMRFTHTTQKKLV